MNTRGRPKFELQEKSLQLYQYIVTHAAYQATDKQLAEALGFGERSVNRYMSWLRKHEYVRVQNERRCLHGMWSNYRLITCEVSLKKFIGAKS